MMRISCNIRCRLVFLACLSVLFYATDSRSESEVTMSTQDDRIVREAYGAGRWFPGSRKGLESMVETYIEEAKVAEFSGRIAGAIAPHAGYPYSGKPAGYTFRAIRDDALRGHRPDVVVVLGISHRGGFQGVALLDGDAIRTPLGEAQLDMEAAKLLSAKSPRIFHDYRPHVGEHSAENEVPFLQVALPGTKMVIGIIGDHDPQTLNDLVDALRELAKSKKILVIASTDMLHDPDYDLVTRTDRETLELAKRMDLAAIQKGWKPSRQIFCGLAPVLVVMRFAELKGCKKGTALYYCNSGDDFPESRGRWVVGYGSIIFVVPD